MVLASENERDVEPRVESDEIIIDDDSGGLDDIPAASTSGRRIRTQHRDPLIETLWGQHKDGDLVLQPEFQRYFVWDNAKSSRLVESVLMDVPLPTIYLVEESDGRESVIDGQQRLTSFFRFLDGELSLSGLKILTELNGKRFADLKPEHKRKFKRASLRTISIQNDSDANLRFEIFERLNTGSVALNEQELRNCVYRGPYNNLLRELADEPDFRFITGITKAEKRMRDVQLVLRAAAFYHATYLNYRSPMVAFLNDDMESYRNISQAKADELARQIRKSCTLVRSMLGTHAFRRFYPGGVSNPNGRWEAKKFNASLFDVLMWGFTQYEKNQVWPYLERLREALIVLMSDDKEFVDAIELSTSSVKMVRIRFDRWRSALDSIVGHPSVEPRCFSRELKAQLYESSKLCAICGQMICDLDDAAVDHIEQYWAGGRTIPENARLAHRYCNAARPRSDVAPIPV